MERLNENEYNNYQVVETTLVDNRENDYIPDLPYIDNYDEADNQQNEPLSFVVTDVKLPSQSTFFRDNRFFIGLIAVLLIGVAIGAMLFDDNYRSEMSTQVYLFLNMRVNSDFVTVFTNSFLSLGAVILFCFIISFCGIAQPVIMAIPLIKGVGIGLTAAYFFSVYGQNGIIATAILLLPNWVISSLLTVIAVKESTRFANRQFRFLKARTRQSDSNPFMTAYIVRFVIITGGIAAIGLVDAIISTLFGFMIEI